MENLRISKPKDICEVWWTEVCKKVRNATVFIDRFVAESLHWSGGCERLMKSGCKDIKEFSSFEVCNEDDDKAVFLIGGAIAGIALDTLREILKPSNLKYVVIVSGAHSSVHAYVTYGGREVDERAVMNKIEEQVLEWLGNLNYTVEIFYYPLLLVAPTEDVFLLPQFRDIFPLFEDEVPDIAKFQLERGKLDKKPIESIEDVEFHHLPFDLRVDIYHLISCIHCFLQGMSAREEIYSLGHLAGIVGGELESYNPARQRRKTAMNKASVVFVDRSLDLVSPTDFDNSVVMSRILSLLPRLPDHQIDSAINLSEISDVNPCCDWTLIPGCFAHPMEVKGREIVQMSILANKKEFLQKLKGEVRSVMEELKKSEGTNDSSSLDELLVHLRQLMGNDKDEFQRHFYLIQQGLAVAETLNHPRRTQLDQLHSLEKMILQSLDDPLLEEESPILQVVQLLKTREKKGITVEEILAVFLHLMSLGGRDVTRGVSEYAITNALSQAFVEDAQTQSHFFSNIFRGEIDEVSALKTASRVWRRLLSVSRARSQLKDYRDLYKRESELEPFKYESLLSRVVEDCLSPPSFSLTDVEYKSAGLKDIIKTGFSLFVNVSKPRPKDAAVMIIYVLGGVTPAEANRIEILVREQRPNCQVLIGSSHFAYPSDVVHQCFEQKL